VLWVFPLLSVGFGYVLAAGLVYVLAKNDVLTLNGQSQGIPTVLVFGAGTDYALLIISQFREELRRHENKYDPMRAALRGAGPAILASGITVMRSLLVPALVYDVGRRVWWPSRLARREESEPGEVPVTVPAAGSGFS
jgi:RND superfamily putative drug exporter